MTNIYRVNYVDENIENLVVVANNQAAAFKKLAKSNKMSVQAAKENFEIDKMDVIK